VREQARRINELEAVDNCEGRNWKSFMLTDMP